MSMNTRVKTVLSGVIASLGLLIFAASPTFANTQNQTRTLNKTSSSTNAAELSQAQTSPRVQQSNQMGCSCCKNMMNNMRGTMDNMPGMMENPSRSR